MADLIAYGSRELFRYVKIEQPRVVDIKLRARQNQALRDLSNKKETEQKEWARAFIESKQRVSQISDLSFPYFEHLKISQLDPRFLPSAKDLKDIKTFKQLNFFTDNRYTADRENTLQSVVAYRLLKMPAELEQTGKILSFLDEFPKLATTKQRRIYAKPVFDRIQFKTPGSSTPSRLVPSNSKGSEEASRYKVMATLSEDIHFLWRAKNQMKSTLISQYDAEIRHLQQKRFEEKVPKTELKALTSGKQRQSSPSQSVDNERQEQHVAFLKERNKKLASLREQRKMLEMQSSMQSILHVEAWKLAEYIPNRSPGEVYQVQSRILNAMSQYKIPFGKFCRVYEEVVSQIDREPDGRDIKISPDCFLENPNIVFENTIRILGIGNLIKVEETFVGYKPAEISYIENILPREMHKREVKSTRYFEQLQENLREETTTSEQETSTASTQELSSEIESEINTRFNSDVNASANVSGGGTIGVVDLSGGAAVNAGLGIGVDTSLSTSDTSNFSQEIVNKAIEKTKKSTIERRLTRSYSLFETTNLHKIDNRSADTARNGIYVFLDKEVCITEIPYGKRLFLLANVMLPGKNLLCKKLTEIQLNMLDRGQEPVFDISPEDIHPHNYRELVGRFRASNVQPPPPPIQTVARTYKTDTTNANVEQQEFNPKKIADLLMPFFERYKRFIITDTITIPEGYTAEEVTVTINHGSNGLSIPAHLPLSVAGASMYAAPSLLTVIPFAGLTLPFIFWQIAYLASPLLYYNTDSSNVTVTVGNESYDSPYYFFPPDSLIQEVFNLFGNFSPLNSDILADIQSMVTTMIQNLGAKAAEMSSELGENISSTINNLMNLIQPIFVRISDLLNLDVTDVNYPQKLIDLSDQIMQLPLEITGLLSTISENFSELMGENFFEPLEIFFNDSLGLISAELNSALAEFFEFFTKTFDNTDDLEFESVAGMRGDIPITLNTVSIKPGVSVTLTLCAVRTEEALDRWRLDTFTSLYQSYLQQMAEYENRLLTVGKPQPMKSPSSLRQEERLAVKELVLHTLNNYHIDRGSSYDLTTINFFENTIDWNNMSYKLYNYGPNSREIGLEKLGAYQHVDERRRAFLKAHWAQVLIPVQENSHFEAQIEKYFEEDTFDFEGDFTNEELAALYQDLILGRELLGEVKESTSRPATLPTDLVIVQDGLPQNYDHTCQ